MKKRIVYKLIALPSLRITKEQIAEFILDLRKWYGPLHLGFVLKDNNYIIFISDKNDQLTEYFKNRTVGYIEDIILAYNGVNYKLNQTQNNFVEVLSEDVGVTLSPAANWENNIKIKNITGRL
jgi:hypothetical protein